MTAVQAFLVAAVVVSAVSAWYDWRTGHIPNWTTLGALAAAPLLHAGVGLSAAGGRGALDAVGFSVLGALLASVVPLLLYRAGAIGGGDVKLLAAVGALCRPLIGIEAEFYGFFAAALLAPARLAWEGKLFRVLGNTVALALNPFLPKERRREITPEMMTSMRFGPAIFVGVLVAAVLNWRTRW